MWTLVIAEAVAGSTAVVGLAYGLARHSRHVGPNPSPPVRVRGDTAPPPAPAPAPQPVTGETFERIWAHAERIGWTRLMAAGVLKPVGPPVLDPGNPVGSRLVLVEHITGAFGDVRVLLAVDASANPDGSYDLIAIPVPGHFADPVEAAAWTYDDPHHPIRTTRAAYAAIRRRT